MSVDGGATLEQLVQPADRPVLPRRHGRSISVSRLRRAAGQRIGRRAEPQRLRRDQLSRLVFARRLRVRLSRAGSGRPRRRVRGRLVPHGDPLRPQHRTVHARVRARHEVSLGEQRTDGVLAAGSAHALLRHTVPYEDERRRHDVAGSQPGSDRCGSAPSRPSAPPRLPQVPSITTFSLSTVSPACSGRRRTTASSSDGRCR